MSVNENNKQDDRIKRVKFTPINLKKELGDDDTASLTWSSRAGYPRISVFTSEKTQKGDKFDYNHMITAPFDYLAICDVYTNLEKAIASEKEVVFKIACLNSEFKDRVKTGNVVVQSTVHIGKDKNGVVYFAVIENDKRKVKFDLFPRDYPKAWHKLYDDNGDEITDKGQVSQRHAKNYLRVMKKLIDSEMLVDGKYITYEDKPNYKTAKQAPKTEAKAESSLEVNADDIF